MSRTFIIIGAFIAFYTLVAKSIGIPLITDFMPLDWFLSATDESEHHKIVSSNEPSYIWIYTILVGILISAFGWFLKTLR